MRRTVTSSRCTTDMTRVASAGQHAALQGIEVGRATAEVKLKEGTFPAGSFIIKRDQPYGRLAKILLEKQNFPDPNLRTYDDTGWTMGLMITSKLRRSPIKQFSMLPIDPVTSPTNPGYPLQGSATDSLCDCHMTARTR